MFASVMSELAVDMISWAPNLIIERTSLPEMLLIDWVLS